MRSIPTNKVSTCNAETMSAMEKLSVTQRHVEAWKAAHFRSETENLRVDKNRSRRGHMRTVTGKGSLEGPVSGEDSLRVEQLDYFEKVLENSVATSEERPEQLTRVGCRATQRMGHSNRINSSSERLDSSTAIILQKHRAREEPSKLRAEDDVEDSDHAKRDGEVLVEAFINASRSVRSWV